jgi:DNA repair protein RecN (Recombination protein N)
MLRYLSIRNLAVIEHAAVEFEPGLNILTGETGAGKSILVEAVGLLLGGRASSELVRTGADAALIEAQFEDTSGEVVVRREVTAQGRSRAFVNGALATAGALRDLADRLLELHGQHEHQVLLDAASHLDLLDDYAGLGLEREAVARAFAEWKQAERDLQAVQLDERQKAARIDLLTFQRDEIGRAVVRAGEDEELAAARQVLANAEKLQRLSAEAYAALYESDSAAVASLAVVWRRVAELAALDPRAVPYLESRDVVKSQLEELALFLRDYRESIDASPARLQEVDDRLVLIERLKRKYGPRLEDILSHHHACGAELERLEQLATRTSELEEQSAAARSRFEAEARRLSAARRSAATRFERAIEQALERLAMTHTRFAVQFNAEPLPDTAWTERGIDAAEFLVSPNPGEELRPLARIASGGELSRVMLAVRGLAAGRGGAGTLIFDEVDAGIGGRAADAVGRALHDLAEGRQVLVITHLPQIAAYGDSHFVVSKELRVGRTLTSIERLGAEARRQELARMMAGGVSSPQVLATAGELLASRVRGRAKGEGPPKGESESRRAKGRK